MSEKLFSGLSKEELFFIVRALLVSRMGSLLAFIGVSIFYIIYYMYSMEILDLWGLFEDLINSFLYGRTLSVSIDTGLGPLIVLIVSVLIYVYGFVGRFMKGVYDLFEYFPYHLSIIVTAHFTYIIYGGSFIVLAFIALSSQLGFNLSILLLPLYVIVLILFIITRIFGGLLLKRLASIIDSGLVGGAGIMLYLSILFPFVEIITWFLVYIGLDSRVRSILGG
ncbi:MAG: hypothetical protein B6U89_04385 [Desulfurococcales archaeon ex4484_58]|nr:MAG: hypothetical protein B6U89_04385 [Desulfurococcales archaeon ex4484_58]